MTAAHATVVSVPARTPVHDLATVTRFVGDADGDGHVLVVRQRHVHRAAPGHVEPVPAERPGGRGRHDVRVHARPSGDFSFQATYSGDGTYDPSVGACEPLEVTPLASSTVTLIHDAAHATVTEVPAGTDGA